MGEIPKYTSLPKDFLQIFLALPFPLSPQYFHAGQISLRGETGETLKEKEVNKGYQKETVSCQEER